jgi:hypothetical protein
MAELVASTSYCSFQTFLSFAAFLCFQKGNEVFSTEEALRSRLSELREFGRMGLTSQKVEGSVRVFRNIWRKGEMRKKQRRARGQYQRCGGDGESESSREIGKGQKEEGAAESWREEGACGDEAAVDEDENVPGFVDAN